MSKKQEVNAYTGEILNAVKPIDMGLFFDDAEAVRHIMRKADRHKTKGKRRVKTNDYRYDLYV